MVMEWLDGRRLGQILKDDPKLPADRALKLAVGICNALEYVHANGVVHRDLGPDKIMVDVNDNVKLFDFGFAAITGGDALRLRICLPAWVRLTTFLLSRSVAHAGMPAATFIQPESYCTKCLPAPSHSQELTHSQS